MMHGPINIRFADGILHLQISKNSTGNRIRNIPSCGAVPQPTPPPQKWKNKLIVPERFQDLKNVSLSKITETECTNDAANDLVRKLTSLNEIFKPHR